MTALLRVGQTHQHAIIIHVSWAAVWRTTMAQFRTHYLTKELAYVSTQQSGQVTMETNTIEKFRIGLTVEYSRMQVPSLSSGFEIAPFCVRYMALMTTR